MANRLCPGFQGDGHSPDNLGLQLDTYWLQAAGVGPSTYSNHSVHSVHLNEREDGGQNCVLGTDPERCANFVRPLIDREPPIRWILENDSSADNIEDQENQMLNIIKTCLTSWPQFWEKLAASPSPPNVSADPSASNTTEPPTSVVSSFSPIPDSRVYAAELRESFTEYLFGDVDGLRTLELTDPRTSEYYVDKRSSTAGSYEAQTYHKEQRLHSLYWPGITFGKQIIRIVGGSGAGKTTFVRFYFQYFLPHYQTLICKAKPASELCELHAESLEHHVVLYADLGQGLDNLWPVLGSSLSAAAERHDFKIDPVGTTGYGEAWFRKQISRLAKPKHGRERKWFISLILDNADQTPNLEDVLMRRVLRWVPQDQSNELPSDPEAATKGREFWRILIPMRVETEKGIRNALDALNELRPAGTWTHRP